MLSLIHTLGVINLQAQADLHTQVQTLCDTVSNVTGFSFSVGYVDVDGFAFGVGSGPRSPRGVLPVVPGTVSGTDTMLLGSGTKPFTAAAVMRLVEQGKVALDDLLSEHIDGVLQRMNGTSLVELLGPKAASVTVGHVLSMRSGINDFDVYSYDHALLNQSDRVHSPLEAVGVVAGFKEPFVCDPGACTSYSSTNFILAGFVLLAHAPPGQQTFETYDQLGQLGLDRARYPTMAAPRLGNLDRVGLTVGGVDLSYGAVEIYEQDASILGWTCGNIAASALDSARFYYELLGPDHSIVSAESVRTMSNLSTIDQGWEAGNIDYGYGLMVQNVAPSMQKRPPLEHVGSYLGHGGFTYAFMSDNGWFPTLNASISIIVNEDVDFNYPTYSVSCQIVEMVAAAQGQPVDLGCVQATPLTYECRLNYGQPTCLPRHGQNMSRVECAANCTNAIARQAEAVALEA